MCLRRTLFAVRRQRWTARLKKPQEQRLFLSGSACRPSPRGATRLGDKAGDPKGRKSKNLFTAPFCGIRPRRASHAPLMRRCARERRFPSESRYSLSAPKLSSIRPNSLGFGLRAPGVGRTAQRAGPAVLRTAKARTTARPNPQPHARPSAARKPITVFAPEEQTRPKVRPVLRSVSASLRLRFRSATLAVARGNSCRIGRVPTGRICPLRRAGDGIFARSFRRGARLWLREETALGPGRPHVPWTGDAYASLRQPQPKSSPHSLFARLRDSLYFGYRQNS